MCLDRLDHDPLAPVPHPDGRNRETRWRWDSLPVSSDLPAGGRRSHPYKRSRVGGTVWTEGRWGYSHREDAGVRVPHV